MILTGLDLAYRLKQLTDEHGTPNHFYLHEIAPNEKPLRLYREFQYGMFCINGWLSGVGTRATYVPRDKNNPASVAIERITP